MISSRELRFEKSSSLHVSYAANSGDFRKRGFNVRVSCVKIMPTTCVEGDAGIVDSHQVTNGGIPSLNTFYHSGSGSLKFNLSRREFSSQASVSDKEEDDDDLEEGFSELEEPVVGEKEKPLSSDTEQSDESEDDEEPCKEAELSDAEIDESAGEKSKLPRGRVGRNKALLPAPYLKVAQHRYIPPPALVSLREQEVKRIKGVVLAWRAQCSLSPQLKP